MENIKVNKGKLMDTMARNREQHRQQFLDAQVIYRERAIEELDRRLQRARDGKKIWDLHFNLPQPRDYTDAYDTAIEMLTWEVGEEIELSERDFQRFVQNNWEWAQAFASSTQAYLVQ
jgi:hypothetical protein